MSTSPVYTHALWRVRPGSEDEFVSAWDALAATFSTLPVRPRWGTLIRSAADCTLFFSFGPWPSEAAAAAMRADPAAQQALARLRGLCLEATPGLYSVVRHVEVGSERAPPATELTRSPGVP